MDETKSKEEALQRLDLEVERLKKAHASRRRINSEKDFRSLDTPERREVSGGPGLPDGVLSVGDAIRSALPIIEKMAKETSAKIAAIRKSVDKEVIKIGKWRECLEHGGEHEVIDIEQTVMLTYRNQEFTPSYLECPVCRSQRLVNERHRKWIKMGVPHKVAHATFANYEADIEPKKLALERAKRQTQKRRGFLLLLGNPGNGKSHLAAAVMKHFKSGIFVTHVEIVDELRQTYAEGGKESMIKKYQNAECMVLDELDPSIKGDDVQPVLYRILADRFDSDKITVLTSNEDLATVLRILGPRLEDRMSINYSTSLFTWASYRKQHREV